MFLPSQIVVVVDARAQYAARLVRASDELDRSSSVYSRIRASVYAAMPQARQPRMFRDQNNQSARGQHADEPRIERRKIDAGLRPVQQHVGHDDGHQRAHRRVTQRDLDAVIEPQPLPGQQERGAGQESRQRESRDHDCPARFR